MKESEKLNIQIEEILDKCNIKIASTKKVKFKNEMFSLMQEKYLQASLIARKEISPNSYKGCKHEQ